MSATTEIDQMLRKAIRLLHSSQPNSATELREMLDEVIKQRHGPEKMLCNTLSKRHLEEEANFPGRMSTPAPHPPSDDTDDIINLTSPTKTISDSPTISDDAMLTTAADDGNLKEFGDLNCCVCGEMMFTATNRLVECSKCGTLYHQECHKPPITDAEASEDQEHNWQCDSCFNKPSTSKAAGIVVIPEPIPLVSKTKSSATSSRSSSSSNSSSPFYRQELAANTSMPSSKQHKSSSSSSSKSHKEERSSSSSKHGVVTPSINIISAEEKGSLQSSSKRPSSHSSSSKSYSSKSSSKHHESSSKRKSSKC